MWVFLNLPYTINNHLEDTGTMVQNQSDNQFELAAVLNREYRNFLPC